MAVKPRSRNTATKANQRSASHSGFHFLNLYQNCQWKWFLKHYLRIVPLKTDAALINGAAFHEGKEIFYNTKSADKAVRKVKREITERRNEYASEELYRSSKERVPIMLENWIEDRGYEDFEDYEILHVEEELHVEIPGTDGKVATMRIDLIARDKLDKEVYIFDTKTSSSSHLTAYHGLLLSDQVTTYWWGVRKALGYKVYGFFPDITYWHKKSTDEGKILNYRGDPISRTDKDLLELEDNFQRTVTEISQKAAAMKSGKFRPSQLFSRNTYYCYAYFRPCEYANICRRSATLEGKIPNGFRKDRNLKGRDDVMTYTDDISSGVM